MSTHTDTTWRIDWDETLNLFTLTDPKGTLYSTGESARFLAREAWARGASQVVWDFDLRRAGD
jgi:hypothetical protein